MCLLSTAVLNQSFSCFNILKSTCSLGTNCWAWKAAPIICKHLEYVFNVKYILLLSDDGKFAVSTNGKFAVSANTPYLKYLVPKEMREDSTLGCCGKE